MPKIDEDDLSKKSLEELKEILFRQEKIIKNKKLLLTLPDKGERVVKFYDKLKDAIVHAELETTIETLLQLRVVPEAQTGLYFGDRLARKFDERLRATDAFEKKRKENTGKGSEKTGVSAETTWKKWEEFAPPLNNNPIQLVSLEESIAYIKQQTVSSGKTTMESKTALSVKEIQAKYFLPTEAVHKSDSEAE